MAARLRRLGSRHWREPVGPAGETVADLVHALTRICAQRERDVTGTRPPGAPDAPERAPYEAALADQLAVVGRDLALAVEASGDPALVTEVLAELRGYARLLKVTPSQGNG